MSERNCATSRKAEMSMSKENFRPEVHGLMPDYRFPRSRDWGMDDAPPCRVRKCEANFAGKCISPAAIKIGPDGRCEGVSTKGLTSEWSTLSEGEKGALEDEAKETK